MLAKRLETSGDVGLMHTVDIYLVSQTQKCIDYAGLDTFNRTVHKQCKTPPKAAKIFEMLVHSSVFFKDLAFRKIAGCARAHFWWNLRKISRESIVQLSGSLIFEYKASEDFLDSSKSFSKFESFG